MIPITLHTILEFHQHILELKNKSTNTIFRGVSKSEYKLRPSIGRIHQNSNNHPLKEIERRLITKFKESAIAYTDKTPSNEFEWLALAQHYGLPTRLLDWTYNPLVALFFSVENNHDTDGLVYATWKIPQLDDLDQNPYQLDHVFRYRPRSVTQRIVNQSSVFTIHNEIDNDWESKNIVVYVIKKELKQDFKEMLYKYGINYKVIYPGLEGLCKDLKWLETPLT